MHYHELTLTELLDDPMTRAVMAADRVDPAALNETLSAVARKLQHSFAAYQQRNCAGWSDQRWLLIPLADQERFSGSDSRMAHASRICRMAVRTGPHHKPPLLESD